MSDTTNDHPIPADVRRWDEFRKLVATIANEAMPQAVVLPAEFTHHHARLLVQFILGDREMRRLMTELLLRTGDGWATQAGEQIAAAGEAKPESLAGGGSVDGDHSGRTSPAAAPDEGDER